MRIALFTAGGLFSFSVGVFLILHGNWIGGVYQIVLAACFPILCEASK